MFHALLDKKAYFKSCTFSKMLIEVHWNNFKNPLIHPCSFLYIYLVPVKVPDILY